MRDLTYFQLITYTFAAFHIHIKNEIKTYVFKHKIPYLDDVSNFSDNYLETAIETQ